MKLIVLSSLALLLALPAAQAAERCLPAKSCKSRKQCYDSGANRWSCVGVLPKKPPVRGPGRGRDDDGISREDSRRLDEAMNRNLCNSAGDRCRDRLPSDPQPQDDLDRAMERNECMSGGVCYRP